MGSIIYGRKSQFYSAGTGSLQSTALNLQFRTNHLNPPAQADPFAPWNEVIYSQHASAPRIPVFHIGRLKAPVGRGFSALPGKLHAPDFQLLHHQQNELRSLLVRLSMFLHFVPPPSQNHAPRLLPCLRPTRLQTLHQCPPPTKTAKGQKPPTTDCQIRNWQRPQSFGGQSPLHRFCGKPAEGGGVAEQVAQKDAVKWAPAAGEDKKIRKQEIL